MASRNAVVLGFAGMGVVVAGLALWLLSGGDPTAPAPEEGVRPEVASASPEMNAPVAGPAVNAPAVAGAIGDGSLRGRLVRGVGKAPVVGDVKITGEGFAPVQGSSGADGRFVLDGVPRGRSIVLRAEAAGVLPAEVPARVPMAGILDVGDVVLGGPVRLEVKVRDSGDRPVSGATVTLHRARANPQSNQDWISVQFDGRDGTPAALTRTTDEQGLTAFEEAPPGSWTVRAAAKGFADEGVSAILVEGAVREPLRIILGPAYSLEGSVLSREGKPVAAAKVRGFRPASWWITAVRDATSTTGADGRYRLEGLARGAVSLAVELSPGVRITAGAVEIPDVTTWDIRLGGGATLKGKVLDDAGGSPVPGVEVTAQTNAENGMGAQGTARTVTGEDGSFLIAGLPPGNLGSLTVRAMGYLPYPGSETGIVMQQTRLIDGETVDKEIRLRRGGVLRGRVLDKAGKAVAGAMVRFKTFSPRGGMEDTPSVKADAEGAFRIEGVPRLKGLLKAEAPGWFQPDYPQQEWQVLRQGSLPEACSAEVPAEGEGVKDLVLTPGGAVEGTVVDKDGKAAAGLSVSVYSKTKGGGGAAGLTDAEGKFRVEGAVPAEDLVASASGPGGLRGMSEPFRLGEGETTQGIRVALKATASLAGRVRREDGASGQGAILRVVPGKQNVNQARNWNWQQQNAPAHPVGADGAFKVEGLYVGAYTIVCEADGAATSDGPVVELAEGEAKEGVEVVLPEEKKVSGKALNPEGAPVPGAAVRARGAAQQNEWRGGPDNDPVDATTDAAGLFTVRGLGKGSWRIIVRAATFSESVQTVDGGKDDLVFNLVAGLSIEGIVTEEGTGAPIAGMSIWGNSTTPSAGGMNMGRSAVTGKDGSFSIKDLSAGGWSLTFAGGWDDPKNDFAQKVQGNVEAGTKDLRVSLVKGLPISGKVKDEAGKAVGGFYVQAIGKDANGNPDYSKNRNAQVQADGSFRLGGLPAGNYDLNFNSSMGQAGGGGAAPTSVKNVAAGTEDLVVTVKAGFPASGKIVDEKGNPPGQQGNFQVMPSDDSSGAGSTWLSFQADGVFTTQPLEPGKTYDITVHQVGSTMGGTLKGVVAGQKDLLIVLKKGGSITGRVVDEAGKAVAQGIPVMAFAEDGKRNEPGGQVWAATGASGEFTLNGLGDHRYKITAGGGNSEYRPTTSPDVYEVGATGVTLRVSAGVTLEGRLVDAKGAGVKPQWLMAAPEGGDGSSNSWVQPKDDGTFVLKGLAPGKVKLMAYLGNKQVDLGSFDAPSAGLSITVPD